MGFPPILLTAFPSLESFLSEKVAGGGADSDQDLCLPLSRHLPDNSRDLTQVHLHITDTYLPSCDRI